MSGILSAGGAGAVGVTGGVAQQSLKFNDDESQYLSWTPASAGNRKTWTWSGWVKRGNIGSQSFLFSSGADSSNRLQVEIESSDTINIEAKSGGSTQAQLRTAQVFRDSSAWYHIVLNLDTTQASSNDRFNLYVNGQEVTAFSTANYPSQNADLEINKAIEHNLGKRTYSSNYFDGYLSDINFIDGQALDATSFGKFTNGYWEKKDYAGSYGTNGFHLTFEDDVVSEGFNAVTYRGTGANQSISGLGLAADLVWIKQRSGAAFHNVFDSLRVVGGDHKRLYTNSTIAEESSTYSGTTNLTSLDGDGFSLGTGTDTNNSGSTYVAWAWDAGSGSPVSNTDGTITSTVKANSSYGFSITSYTGTGVDGDTVGHGLSSAPELAIIKGRTGAGYPWAVYGYPTNSAFPADGSVLYLNDTAAMTESTGSELSLGASTISFVDSGANINGSGQDYICYAFNSVAGYSKISSYSGTGAAGNAVTGLGFKPAFLMIKRTDVAADWLIWDTTRDVDGKVDSFLYPNLSIAEAPASNVATFTNDGFTLNDGTANRNASGGTYIYMAFADTREAAFWKDVSGQGNHWTPNNLDYRDSLPDSPANNFATHNPLASLGGMTFFEGNTKVRHADIGSYNHARSTMGMTTGKWYWEWYNSGSSGDAPTQLSGIVNDAVPVSTSNGYVGQNANGYSYSESGARYHNASNIGTISVPTGDSSGIWMLAYDADDGKLYVGKNGTWANSGNPSAGTGALFTGIDTDTTWYPAGYTINNDVGRWRDIVVNHGQDSTFAGAKPMGAFTDDNSIGNFQYAPPAGYLALCTANLPTPTIIDGSEYFNTVLYTGNGTTNNITGVGFQPDFVWAKGRNAVRDHILLDVIRGTTKMLSSNLTAAEVTGTDFASFDADGFTLNAVDTTGGLNASGGTFASWNWKAGGAAVSNTAGTITSQVSANVDAGFSIVSYTGTGAVVTVGHGLSSEPKLIITKPRSQPYSWGVYNAASGPTKYMYLEAANAAVTDSAFWNNTSPTSSVWTMGSEATVNQSGATYIAYCFADVEGFSKTGTYVGTGAGGANSGPFVYCGFRPALVIIKQYDAARNWSMYDSKREPTNDGKSALLYPNLSNAEYNPASADQDSIDFLSNGFKLQSNAPGSENVAGGNYLFIAFAETPFKYSNAR